MGAVQRGPARRAWSTVDVQQLEHALTVHVQRGVVIGLLLHLREGWDALHGSSRDGVAVHGAGRRGKEEGGHLRACGPECNDARAPSNPDVLPVWCNTSAE